MADFAPMRTGQLVVRYNSSWRRRTALIGAALAALALLYVMYEWGRFEGGYSKFAEVQRRRELTAQIEELESTNEKLRLAGRRRRARARRGPQVLRRCGEKPRRSAGAGAEVSARS